MLEIFKEDWKHYKKKNWNSKYWFEILKSKTLRYILAGRYSANNRKFSNLWGGGTTVSGF